MGPKPSHERSMLLPSAFSSSSEIMACFYLTGGCESISRLIKSRRILPFPDSSVGCLG